MADPFVPNRYKRNKSVSIHPAKPDDAEVIYNIQRKGWVDTYPNKDLGITKDEIRLRVEGENGKDVPLKIEQWKETIKKDDGTHGVFVASLSGDVTGFVAPGLIDGDHRIGAIYVLTEAQGLGIGAQLLTKAIEWHGRAEDIFIHVASYNQNAIDFYKRFGFVETGKTIEDDSELVKQGKVKPIPQIEMILKADPDKNPPKPIQPSPDLAPAKQTTRPETNYVVSSPTITHQQQKDKWEEEHKAPNVLPQMDAGDASGGVVKFLQWMMTNGKKPEELAGLEMCCGKGRNVIWLAKQGVNMIGIDFSAVAINEAQSRAKDTGVGTLAHFAVQDTTLPYPIKPASLDFAFDCFGSTDIESVDGREAARNNVIATLKPGGYLMLYLLSSDDEFQKEMIADSPGPDEGSFINPINGKYEKSFSEEEIKGLYKELKLCTLERIPKKVTFFGKEYNCNYIWAVFQKN
jgi:ribosomal protein S18 acetylase RimI-like enzyme/SAM-dependent methyltransferase